MHWKCTGQIFLINQMDDMFKDGGFYRNFVACSTTTDREFADVLRDLTVHTFGMRWALDLSSAALMAARLRSASLLCNCVCTVGWVIEFSGGSRFF